MKNVKNIGTELMVEKYRTIDGGAWLLEVTYATR
jgi:hypothetical protein